MALFRSKADRIIMLELICSEKAEHIRSNWQDTATAKSWDRDARKIAAILPKIEN